MRIVSYDSERGARAGVLRGEEVIDAWDALGAEGAGVRELLAADRLDELATVLDGAAPVERPTLLAPVPDPEKIIGIGLNYRDHAAEAGREAPESPTFFAKFRNACGPTARPCNCRRRAPRSTTRRRWPSSSGAAPRTCPRAMPPITSPASPCSTTCPLATCSSPPRSGCPARFDGAAPCGPAIVTLDEAGPLDAIGIALDLNGERMQEASTAELIHSIPSLLAHLSRLMTLEPGDIVATGTPAGVGGAREPRVWLKSGDELVVSSPQLGELRTTIVSGRDPRAG